MRITNKLRGLLYRDRFLTVVTKTVYAPETDSANSPNHMLQQSIVEDEREGMDSLYKPDLSDGCTQLRFEGSGLEPSVKFHGSCIFAAHHELNSID